jgi:hypothetical protein
VLSSRAITDLAERGSYEKPGQLAERGRNHLNQQVYIHAGLPHPAQLISMRSNNIIPEEGYFNRSTIMTICIVPTIPQPNFKTQLCFGISRAPWRTCLDD